MCLLWFLLFDNLQTFLAILSLVPIRVHFLEHFEFLVVASDHLVELLIIIDFFFVFFIIIVVTILLVLLSDEVFEFYLALLVTCLLVEHTRLDDFVV